MAAGLSPNLKIDCAVQLAHDLRHWLLARVVAALCHAGEMEAIQRLLRCTAILLGSRKTEFMGHELRLRHALQESRKIARVVKREAPGAPQHRHRNIERGQ